MTPYHDVFFPIFMLGCVIATAAAYFAARAKGFLLPNVLLLVGVLALWIAMVVGSDLGYRAWQSMPDPPDEAFRDASAAGALVCGWIPSGMYCLFVFGILRVIDWCLRSKHSAADAMERSLAAKSPNETGNPYQGPNP